MGIPELVQCGLKEYLFKKRLDVALDLEKDATEKFTGSYFHEEIRGMADSTGLDEKVSEIQLLCHFLLTSLIFIILRK